MKNLLHRRDEVVTVEMNVRKSHHQPQCILKFVCEDSKSSVSVTIRCHTHVSMNFFLAIIYTIASKIIDLSS